MNKTFGKNFFGVYKKQQQRCPHPLRMIGQGVRPQKYVFFQNVLFIVEHNSGQFFMDFPMVFGIG